MSEFANQTSRSAVYTKQCLVATLNIIALTFCWHRHSKGVRKDTSPPDHQSALRTFNRENELRLTIDDEQMMPDRAFQLASDGGDAFNYVVATSVVRRCRAVNPMTEAASIVAKSGGSARVTEASWRNL